MPKNTGHRRRFRPFQGKDGAPQNRWIGSCPDCGKHRFQTRREARNAWKALHPGAPISVYRCGDFFHYGNNTRKRSS